jgi:hypothetical protein
MRFQSHKDVVSFIGQFPNSSFIQSFFSINDTEKLKNIIRNLEHLGYFKSASAENIDLCKQNLFAMHSPIDGCSYGDPYQIRTIYLDAEDLYESGCVNEIQKFFNLPSIHEIIHEPTISDSIENNTYILLIGSTRYYMWKYGLSDNKHWYIAVARTILIMNYILDSLNKPDRVYFEYDGNSSFGVLLTTEMVEVLVKNNVMQPAILSEDLSNSED